MSEILRLDNTISALSRSMLMNRETGMGTMRDSFTNTEVGAVPILGEQELRSLHRGNWWIRRIIDVPAMDMVKGGVSITHPSNDAEAIQKVMGLYEAGGEQSPYSRKMGGALAFQRAEMYARWFGRGYIVLRVNGNEKLEKPLTKVKSFEGFSVLDRYQLRPSNDSVNYEDPEFYQIARRYQRGGELKGADFNQRIHETRVLVFDGAFIHPYDINLESADGAHDSVVQSLYECFCRHYAVQNAIAKGLDSYSLFKVAIANLGELMMQDEGEAALTKTLDAIAEMVSLHRILVQDSDAANSEFQERSFTGVAENANGFKEELTAASGLPHYKLWGSVDKSGLADSGGAESRAWADTINSLQIAKFKDNHRRLFNALFEATGGSIPDGYEIEYPSVYKATPKEEAEIRETEANTYSTLVTAEVLNPLEVKLALATGEDISNVLDAEAIEKELEKSKELAQKQLEVEEAELEQSVQAATAAPTEGVEGEEQSAGQRTVNGQVVPDLDTAIAQLDSFDAPRIDKKKGKKRNCKKGISCGNSCISRLKTCRKTPTAKQVGLAQQIRNTVVPFDRPKVTPQAPKTFSEFIAKGGELSDSVAAAKGTMAKQAAMEKLRESLIERGDKQKALAFVNSLDMSKVPSAERNGYRRDLGEFSLLTGSTPNTLRYIIRDTDRAYANRAGVLNVGAPHRYEIQRREVVFHEAAHHLEFTRKDAAAAAAAWIESRRSGPNARLSELTGNKSYQDSEIAIPDKFINPYVGKVYKSGATEVLSMGLEKFRDAGDMLELFRDDREHFDLILGIISEL
ncbi:MAG: phage portal protein [Cyanobacteria bacterium J06634_6]